MYSSLDNEFMIMIDNIKKSIPKAASYFPTDNIGTKPLPPPKYPKLSKKAKVMIDKAMFL